MTADFFLRLRLTQAQLWPTHLSLSSLFPLNFLLRGIYLASLYVKMTEGDDVIDNPSHTHQYDK